MAGPRREDRSYSRLRIRVLLLLIVSSALIAACPPARGSDPPRIPAVEAIHHVGEVAEVCGQVASAAYITSVGGAPTFLNIGGPYPDQHFTVVIWESTRPRFERPPERMFDRRSICVTGRIEMYRGVPQIIVEDPDQIVVAPPAGGGGELSDSERILVKALLTQLGHETDYGTGEWDEGTVEAVVSFQEASGLPTTGDADPATLRALAGAVGEIPEADRTMVIRLLLFEVVRRLE